MKQTILLLLFLTLLFFCEFNCSMNDPEDPSYEAPSFTIDTDASNVADGDTVTADTLKLTLIGNDEVRHENSFRWSLDDTNWTKWDGDGEETYEITLTELFGGTHTLIIEVCYDPEGETSDSTITFFRALTPSITAMSDTSVSVDAEATCTLRVEADGSGELKYVWYHDNDELDSATGDSLLLESVTLADTGIYYCLVTNAWGEAESPTIQLRVLFRVFYDGNDNTGGTVPVDTNGYEPGAIATTPGNPGSLTRLGYTFAGWNTEADGSGTSYSADTTILMEMGDVTLYAMWSSISSTAGMVLIAAKDKSFSMGSTNGYSNEKPVHTVTFSFDFWIDTTEVTQGEYDALMSASYGGYASPSWSSTYGTGDNYPVYNVNWYDAALYCNARTKASGSNDTVYSYTSISGTPGNNCELDGLSIDLSKGGFRLPTEAQWEYACRGETTTDYYWGKDYDPYPSTAADSNEVDAYAVWDGNSKSLGSGDTDYGTHPVATKVKNPFGLYDMSGNVYEWCNDCHAYYDSEPQTDPAGPLTCTYRMIRGGSWNHSAFHLRSTYRTEYHARVPYNYIGFRSLLPER